MPNNKCCRKLTETAVGQAACCPKWARSAAAPTANPVQNGQDLLPFFVLIIPAPMSIVPTEWRAHFRVRRPRPSWA
eukprot:3460502-Pyramimonas_sp.AAC.1